MTRTPASPYHVALTDEAIALLDSITTRDRRIAGKLCDHIEALAITPSLKGSHLRGDFSGLLSHHCLGNRFRIIYQINESQHTVTIISLGMRKAGDKRDIYELTKKILRKL